MATLVVFALEREAKPFRRRMRGRTDVRIEVCGVGCGAVERTLPGLLKEGSFATVVMAGFCGSLNPGLSVGDVVVPTAVVDETGASWACAIDSSEPVRLLTMNRMVGEPLDKLRLSERHDAVIVDMESTAAARICEAAGVRFTAVRAVSDDVRTRLSPDLMCVLAGGSVSPWRVLTAILRRPTILREFLRLGRDTSLAAKRLAERLEAICTHLPSRVVPQAST